MHSEKPKYTQKHTSWLTKKNNTNLTLFNIAKRRNVLVWMKSMNNNVIKQIPTKKKEKH